MNPGWSSAHQRASTLAFDRRAASARLDASQNATERKPPDKGTAGSLLLRFLYWIYERRLLNQLKQKPTPRHVGIILGGNRRHARKRGLSCRDSRGRDCDCAIQFDDIDNCSWVRRAGGDRRRGP